MVSAEAYGPTHVGVGLVPQLHDAREDQRVGAESDQRCVGSRGAHGAGQRGETSRSTEVGAGREDVVVIERAAGDLLDVTL